MELLYAARGASVAAMSLLSCGVCAIKQQFVRRRENEDGPVDDGEAAADDEARAGNGDRRQNGGQNKKRPRVVRAPRGARLCPSLVQCSSGTCAFAGCQFQHDVGAYTASKPPDLAGPCPNFDAFGRCRFGFACRFAGRHVQTNGGDSPVTSNSSAATFHLGEANRLANDVRQRLRKHRYDFGRADGAVANDGDVQRLVGTDRADAVRPLLDHWHRKLLLAPLTTLGNLPLRRICVEYGAEITCSEMVMAEELLKGHTSEWALIRRHESEKYFGVQLCGANVDVMAKAAKLLVDQAQVDFVDLNLACPMDLVCDRGMGCMMMKRPTRLRQVVEAVSAVLRPAGLPLSAKLRTGLQTGSNTALQLIPLLKEWGVDVVTMHGRSRDQRFTKLADWDYFSQCAAAMEPCPFYGFGDTLSFSDYFDKLQRVNVGGVGIARGALIKPWIFTEIQERRHWDISASERLEMLKKYVSYGLQHWGSDQQGVDLTRRFLLEFLSFLYRYVPVGLLERVPQKINERPPPYVGRSDLETLMASQRCSDWIKITEMLLGPVPDDFKFLPKHKANSY